MKTIQDKKIREFNFKTEKYISYYKETDVKKHLTKFYNEYWKEAFVGDKDKNYISCDELDYLMAKHFGELVKIKTIQDLSKFEKVIEK